MLLIVTILILLAFLYHIRFTTTGWSGIVEFFTRPHIKIWCGIMLAIIAGHIFECGSQEPSMGLKVILYGIGCIPLFFSVVLSGYSDAAELYRKTKQSM